MLSVINRGTLPATVGLPYELINGYMADSYKGEALNTAVLSGIPKPLDIPMKPSLKYGYETGSYEGNAIDTIVVHGIEKLSVSITPIMVDGYSQIDVNPTEA